MTNTRLIRKGVSETGVLAPVGDASAEMGGRFTKIS